MAKLLTRQCEVVRCKWCFGGNRGMLCFSSEDAFGCMNLTSLRDGGGWPLSPEWSDKTICPTEDRCLSDRRQIWQRCVGMKLLGLQ